MNPIFQKIAIEAVKRRRRQIRPGQKISRYEVGKEFFKLRVEATHLLTDAFLISLGVSLSRLRAPVLDGTEVLAIFLSRRAGVTIGDIILVFNVIIFSVAASCFQSKQLCMQS